MLDKDTYNIVEQLMPNDTDENPFTLGIRVAWRFEYFFRAVYPSTTGHNYPGIEEDRINITSYTTDFVRVAIAALAKTCAPFGHRDCGFFPDNLRPDVRC